jgi:hypothetical protein
MWIAAPTHNADNQLGRGVSRREPRSWEFGVGPPHSFGPADPQPGKQDNKDDNDVEMEESSPKDRKVDRLNLVGQYDTKLNTVPGHSTKEKNVNGATGGIQLTPTGFALRSSCRTAVQKKETVEVVG